MEHDTTAKSDQTALGIGIILASVLAMSFADAVVKLVSANLTVWQLFVARSVFAIPTILALLVAMGIGLELRTPKWAFIRSALLVLTWLAFYASLPVLSLSVAAVAVYTNPIMTALLSAALTGEQVSGRQWSGVLLGFLGVITILKPGTEAFSWFTLLPLLGAAFYSVAMVLTRSKCREEAPLMLALALHGSFLIAGAAATVILLLVGLAPDSVESFPFLLDDWMPMGPREWGLMALLGVLSAVYFVGVARAYQIAAPPIIATFDYAYLISAAFWGFLFFSDTPDRFTVFGMILIVAAGLLVTARSSTRGRAGVDGTGAI